ncbi:MAG: isoprenyl transferase [Bacteroidota bacterium]|nr:isoprenyl transferase [Bacteroidota bacterium]
MELKEQIDFQKLPSHVGIIMDGNGRWAKKKGRVRIFGHKNGVKAVREVTEAAAELGVKFLTLYAFSSENWNRPKKEVDALMSLLVNTINSETKILMKNNIRLVSIGDISRLGEKNAAKLNEAIEITKNNDRMTLNLALSYSGRSEITDVVKKIAVQLKEDKISIDDITEEFISSKMFTASMPDPELLIRTSGEQRLSNFLLWQLAYSELYFCDTLWPDFCKDDFYKALIDYQQRERRFGKISEQIKK